MQKYPRKEIITCLRFIDVIWAPLRDLSGDSCIPTFPMSTVFTFFEDSLLDCKHHSPPSPRPHLGLQIRNIFCPLLLFIDITLVVTLHIHSTHYFRFDLRLNLFHYLVSNWSTQLNYLWGATYVSRGWVRSHGIPVPGGAAGAFLSQSRFD